MMVKWINIPNFLSGIRILTIPLIVFLIICSNPTNFPILVLVFFFSIWLDFFDGYLARKLSQETKLGQILDPIADKLMISCIVIALIIKSDFPIWLGILIITRDILILTASVIIFKGRHKIKPSILIGKVAFASMCSLIIIYLLDLYVYVNLEILKRFFIVVTVAFLGWSWVEYYQIFKREKQNERSN